jgi:hypothetical protein
LLDRPELSGVRLALDRAIDAPGVTHLRYVRRAR